MLRDSASVETPRSSRYERVRSFCAIMSPKASERKKPPRSNCFERNSWVTLQPDRPKREEGEKTRLRPIAPIGRGNGREGRHASKLSPKQCQVIARTAARKRWS